MLSSISASPVIGGRLAQRPTQIESARSGGYTFTTVSRAKLADGKVETINVSSFNDDAGNTATTEVIHEPDGTREVDRETAVVAGYTTTFTKAITLPGGTQQTETGTETRVGSGGMILHDGTVQPSSTDLIFTTTFNHAINQSGLGTETITGTTIVGTVGRRTITVTDQQVTHFDGSRDTVHILTTSVAGSATTETTTTPTDGTATTVTSTTKLLSSRLS